MSFKINYKLGGRFELIVKFVVSYGATAEYFCE